MLDKTKYIGEKFGRLSIVDIVKVYSNGQKDCLCICECGNEKIVRLCSLRNGGTKSCGCLQRELMSERAKTHGMSYSKINKTWRNMKDRCFNSNSQNYHRYGGRGISVCDEWLIFENFYKDMGDAPIGMSLDRIDNDKNYCKENCKWSSQKEQANNRNTNLTIKFNKESITLSKICKLFNVGYNKAWRDIFTKGKSVDDVFSVTNSRA